MRRFMTLLSLLLLVVGCSSGPDSGDIAFEHAFNPFETSVWTATGEAIQNDLLCSAATGTLEGLEDEDGATRMPDELEALIKSGKQFVEVTVESMTCDDASGDFTLRFIREIGPSVSDGERVIDVTWTITGGSGYDTTSGEGDSLLFNGTGTITKD